MKKYLPLLFVCASIAVSACAQTKKTTTAVATPAQQAPAAGTAYDWVKISRGACFGRCPIYTVKVLPNGFVQYYGQRFVTHEGLFEKQWPSAEVAGIFRDFETYRVDTCQNNYPVRVTDLPTLTIEYSYRGETRKITNANFGPGLLTVLAKEIDAVAQVDETWKKTGDAAPE